MGTAVGSASCFACVVLQVCAMVQAKTRAANWKAIGVIVQRRAGLGVGNSLFNCRMC